MPSFGEICAAMGWGALSSVGLVVGAVLGVFARPRHHQIALAMSVAAGLLLAAASLKLATEAIRVAGAIPAVLSLLLGAVVASAINAVLGRFGAANRKRCGECTPQPSEAQQPDSGLAIAIGTAIDAAPEALVIGLTLRERAVPMGLLVAVALANVPEALSGAAGMRSAGRSNRYILVLWCAIPIGAALATAAGYASLAYLGQSWPLLQAFGAGALLAMTLETMIPEAFHNSPRFSGFLAVVGFSVVLLMEAASRGERTLRAPFDLACFLTRFQP
jgi:zinc transporter, ZIP family